MTTIRCNFSNNHHELFIEVLCNGNIKNCRVLSIQIEVAALSIIISSNSYE
ncbi:hypothetical protein DSUL_100192 [Desulfovibrionales bacterium]